MYYSINNDYTMIQFNTFVLLSAIAIQVVNSFCLTPFYRNKNVFYSIQVPFVHDSVRENVPSITTTSLNRKNQQNNKIIRINCYYQVSQHPPRPRLSSCYDGIRNSRIRSRPFKTTLNNQEQEIDTITTTTSNITTTFNDTTTTKVVTRTTNMDNFTFFCTPPIPVYIEDTDAYGVMYNGNYIRAYDRSFHYYFNKNMIGVDSWIMIHIHELKFKVPPKLGDCFCISGIMSLTINDDSNNDNNHKKEIQSWDMSMHSVDGSILYSTATGVQVVHASDTVLSTTVLSQRRSLVQNALVLSQDSNAYTTNLVDTFVTYHDEYDSNCSKFQEKSFSYYYLPLHTCLKYMERSRSNFIGGPIQLQQLQKQDNVLYVVTSLRDSSSLIPYWQYVGSINKDDDKTFDTTNNSCHPLSLIPGSNVHVETSFVVRKKGMVIDCYHTIKIDHITSKINGTSPCPVTVAHGHITLIALDATTRRPTNKIPQWLQQKIMK